MKYTFTAFIVKVDEQQMKSTPMLVPLCILSTGHRCYVCDQPYTVGILLEILRKLNVAPVGVRAFGLLEQLRQLGAPIEFRWEIRSMVDERKYSSVTLRGLPEEVK